jgi:hypothetical protein
VDRIGKADVNIAGLLYTIDERPDWNTTVDDQGVSGSRSGNPTPTQPGA